MNRFDRLSLFLLATVCILTLIRLTDTVEGESHYGTLTVIIEPDNTSLSSLTKIKEGDVAISEGRFAFTYSKKEGECALLLARGRLCEAGYMHEGGRLLAKNQPIELVIDTTPIYGRIKEIILTAE